MPPAAVLAAAVNFGALAPHAPATQARMRCRCAARALSRAPQLAPVAAAPQQLRRQRMRAAPVCAAVPPAAAAAAAAALLDVRLAAGASSLHALSEVRSVETVLFTHALNAARYVVHTFNVYINNPWEPEEILFIAAWVVAVRPAMYALFRVRQAVLHCSWAVPAHDALRFDDSGFARLAVPLRQLGWCFGALWAFDSALSLAAVLGTPVNHSLPFIAGFPDACYTVWAGYLALFLQNEWFARAARGPSTAMAQRGYALITITVTALAATYMLGLNPATLLAFGGLAGFASSLAIKDQLVNLFAGVTLAVQRPFTEGDDVILNGNAATVVTLGYFRTILRDADSHLIYVPNGLFINQSIANAGRGTHTRVAGGFVISYQDAPRLEKLLHALVEALRAVPQVDESLSPVTAVCAGYTAQGIAVNVDAQFRRGTLSSGAVTSAAWLAVGDALARQGCSFAPPAPLATAAAAAAPVLAAAPADGGPLLM